MLRATTACTFSTSQLPKVVRTWCVLYILASKCASRHNGMQFFISHLPGGLRTRRFSEPTFRPSGATNHWKNRVVRDFPTFSGTWIFFLLSLSLFDLLSSSLLFSSPLLSSSLLFFDSYDLCFSSVHIVGSLTSKLPLTNGTWEMPSLAWLCFGMPSVSTGCYFVRILGAHSGHRVFYRRVIMPPGGHVAAACRHR